MVFRKSVVMCTGVWVLFGAVRVGHAQVSFEPRALLDAPLKVSVPGACGDGTKPECAAPDLLVQLNKQFRQGDWPGAQKLASDILNRANAASGKQGSQPWHDADANYIWVTWIGPDSFGADALNRMLVHSPPTKPFSLGLSGERRIYEVFLSRTDRAEIASRLTSTPQPNPISSQLVDVAGKVLPVAFGLFAATAGAVPSPPPPPPPRQPGAAPPPPTPTVFWVMPFEIDLSDKRASIAVHTVASDRLTSSEFDEAADRFSIRQSFRRETCLRDLVIAEVQALKTAYAGQCSESAQGCMGALNQALRDAFDAQRGTAACVADDAGMTDVDAAVREFAAGHLGRQVTADTTFVNAPLQHVSFGLVEAVALYAKMYDPRVKLADDGTIKADPLPRLMTIVTVNYSVGGYDSSTVSPSSAEKRRWFFGAVVAPDFGIAGGYSYMPIRGLSINVGGAVLLVKSALQEAIGKEPVTATDPFKLGSAVAAFLGVGYSFK